MKILGIDTLEFGFYVEDYNNNKQIASLLENLYRLKKAGQTVGVAQYLELNDISLTVALSGIAKYKYMLTCDDFIIYFADKVSNTNPPIRVKFLSSFLWSFGYKDAYNRFLKWLDCLDLETSKTQLYRLDICTDTDEVKFNKDDHVGFITRAKCKDDYGTIITHSNGLTFQGFTIGRGSSIRANIYNKTIEIKISEKQWFEDIWKHNGWDTQKYVWRIEFQLKSKILREFGLNYVEDILGKEGSLWKHLTNKWLVLKSPKKGNVSRWKTKKKWLAISNSDICGETPMLIRQKVRQGGLDRLLDQGGGIALSIAAKLDYENIEQALNTIKAHIVRKFEKNGTTFLSEKEKRCQMLKIK